MIENTSFRRKKNHLLHVSFSFFVYFIDSDQKRIGAPHFGSVPFAPRLCSAKVGLCFILLLFSPFLFPHRFVACQFVRQKKRYKRSGLFIISILPETMPYNLISLSHGVQTNTSYFLISKSTIVVSPFTWLFLDMCLFFNHAILFCIRYEKYKKAT